VSSGAANLATWLVIGGLIVAIALVGELTRRLFRPPAAAEPAAAAPQIPPALLGMLQFATAVVAAFVPLAAGIYLLVTVAWTLGQRLVLRRIYPATS